MFNQCCLVIIKNNMNLLHSSLFFALFLFETKFVLGGKSEDKCNEYIQLSHQRRERSVGKVEASAHEFPHMAALLYGDKDEILCGGSLISDQYVVTAAHCFHSPAEGSVKKVRLGDYNIVSNADDADVQEFTVVERIKHPDYQASKKYHDIGLLKLDRKVTFTKFIRPACLQVEENIGTNNVIASGWGLLDFGGERSEKLMKVKLDLYTNEECAEYYKKKSGSRRLPDGITSNMICAGGRTEPKSTCQGDAGGPLQIPRSGKSDVYNLVGVISFGVGCGIVNSPEVGTRISSYVPWIESIVWT